MVIIKAMIDFEAQLKVHFPELFKHKRLSKQILKLIKVITHEEEINEFMSTHQHLKGLDFLEEILEYLDFSYSVSNQDRENIPVSGRAIIVSNHPIGSLDGFALLKFIKEIRPDVKILVNKILYSAKPLREFFIPLDNMGNKSYHKATYQATLSALKNDELVIIFPAGEVSRIRPSGVKDGPWQTGFLHFAQQTGAAIIPLFIDAKNSVLFYGLSALFKPLGTAMLAHEMLNKNHQDIRFKVSKPITHQTLKNLAMSKKQTAKLLKKHLYLLAKKPRQYLLNVDESIAHPMAKKSLKNELKQNYLLGGTEDGKKIFLLDYEQNPCVMKEIGRLRELSFRAVNEGTGKPLDLDNYDRYYRHIVLWDEKDLEIIGAYRIAQCDKILEKLGKTGLYSHSLFEISDDFLYLAKTAIELGRSFVQPRYWGLRGLDYLWQGIGAYLLINPQYKIMFGCVSLSNDYSNHAKNTIIDFYSQQFPAQNDQLVKARLPFNLDKKDSQDFSGDYRTNFKKLNTKLDKLGVKVPTLYRQYTELCYGGGVEFLGFNIDPEFNYCIDGLILVHIDKIKDKKRKRYIESHLLGTNKNKLKSGVA